MIERIRTYTPHHKIYYDSAYNEVHVAEGVAYRCVNCGNIWLRYREANAHECTEWIEDEKTVKVQTKRGSNR